MVHQLYLPIEELLDLIRPSRIRDACRRVLRENGEAIGRAWGSSRNHQAWPGGYLDHVAEVMNIARVLYGALASCRPLPFSRSDALLVLFLHDIEKPWRWTDGPAGERANNPDIVSKEQKKAFREELIRRYGIELSPEQMNALAYVEGENDDYTPNRRVMNELAAFCHLCDVTSARIWHDRPSADDPWAPGR